MKSIYVSAKNVVGKIPLANVQLMKFRTRYVPGTNHTFPMSVIHSSVYMGVIVLLLIRKLFAGTPLLVVVTEWTNYDSKVY